MSVPETRDDYPDLHEPPTVEARDWGDAGIVLYEVGNTGGWIKASTSDFVVPEDLD